MIPLVHFHNITFLYIVYLSFSAIMLIFLHLMFGKNPLTPCFLSLDDIIKISVVLSSYLDIFNYKK